MVYLIGYHRFTDFQSTLPVIAKRSHHSPLRKEGKFAVCLSWYFIAENRIKQFAYSISQSAALTALFTKESLAPWIVYILLTRALPLLWFKMLIYN